MGSSWLAYLAVTLLTGNPLIGLLVAALLFWGGQGWFRGRLWLPTRTFARWQRIRALRETIAANPNDATARGQLGGLLVDSRPAEAKALLEEVHRRYPDLALVAADLGAARLNLGDTDGGRAAIEHGLKLKKDLGYGEPSIRLGDHLVARKRFDEAVVSYERALKAHTSSAEAYFKLGWAKRKRGDREGAQAAFRAADELSRGAPAFKRRIDRPWRLRAAFWSRLS